MRHLHSTAVAAFLSLVAAAAANAQLITINVEQYNIQTSASATAVADYTFYATVEDVDGVSSATVTADAGALNSTIQPIPYEGDFFEYESPLYSTSTALLTDFPLTATYTTTVAGTTAGTATIAGPGGSFATLLPATPVFTISGVTGTWSVTDGGQGVFTFDPTGVTSFTVTTNGYSADTLGGTYGAFFAVGSAESGYFPVGEVGVGPEVDGTPYSAPVFTFTNGLAANGGDTIETTYGFTNGSVLELEAGFFNVFNLAPSGIGDSEQAFVVGNVTSFLLRAEASAIPEPATYAQIFAVVALAAVIYRRRKKR